MGLNGLAANPMRAEQHLDKAGRNLEAAQSNLESGFHEVAVNRSYYAAFEAARAALLKPGAPLPRSHGGPASEFGLRVVKEGHVRPEVGRMLGQLERDRLIADYEGDIPNSDEAQESLAMARTVVESVRTAVFAKAGDSLTEAPPAPRAKAFKPTSKSGPSP